MESGAFVWRHASQARHRRRIRYIGKIYHQYRIAEAQRGSDVLTVLVAVTGYPLARPQGLGFCSKHFPSAGATQDMLALNIDLASLMQAGRWQTTVMRCGMDFTCKYELH